MSSQLKIPHLPQSQFEGLDPLVGGDGNELIHLSQVLAAHPDDSGAYRRMYEALRRWLDHNAFLAYVSESPKFYKVRTRSGFDLNVPKDRAIAPSFPSTESSLLHSAAKWLAISILGLFLGGVLTVLAGPIIISQACAAWATQHLNRAEKARAITFILSALLLMFVGTILSALLIVHIIY